MSLDLGIDLVPNGGNGITLTYTDPSGTTVLARKMPALDAKKLDDLRRGDSKEAIVDALQADISAWILGKELAKPLGQLLGGNQRYRVLVRMDRELLAALSDLPVELMTLPKALQPLVLHPNIGAMVHVPPVGAALPPPPVRDWPLRILIARSNPIDLGGAVPEVQILDAAGGMPDGAVQVEVVSSEAAGDDPVTWQAFRKALASQVFDVFVYLGHGDLQQGPTGTAPVGYLQFESPDGKGHESIDARRIAAEFLQHPVRVVVLAGCMTGAQLQAAEQETQDLVASSLPQWQRGAQGVAQAIVDSEAPVELAIGMRDRLEVGDAGLFLASFFRSLIDSPDSHDRGDVEKAIRAARADLFGNAPIPPTWSSAVVFVKGAAPFFPFLAEPPPQATFSAEKQKKVDGVREARRAMAKLFVDAVSDRTPFLQALAAVADSEKAAVGKDAMVKPRFLKAPAGPADIEVELLGSIKARRLEGKVSIGGEDVAIDRLVPHPRLDDSGWDFLSGDADSKVKFVLEREAGSPPAKLAAGPLFTIKATIGGTAPAIHEVVVTRAATDGSAVLWSGVDVIAVIE